MKNNLRILAKKKRLKINLDVVSKNNLIRQVKYCLDDVFCNYENISTASLYYPINNEIEPFEFIKYFEDRNITMSMPVVDIKTQTIIFRKWSPKDKLTSGPFGILEPNYEKEIVLPQIMVVPLLMFDRELFRLGYGGGFYDKSIIKLKKYFQKEKKFFITIGLSYSEQEIDKIPYENHDMNLDYIVTEKEFLSRKSSTLN